MHPLKMDRAALETFLREAFPQVAGMFDIRAVAPRRVDVALRPDPSQLRPGGTVSGPTLFALADVAMYLAVLSAVGPRALAVTTSASVDFMRKPPAQTEITATAELLKLGRVLAVGDVRIHAAGLDAGPVARASLTYSIPSG